MILEPIVAFSPSCIRDAVLIMFVLACISLLATRGCVCGVCSHGRRPLIYKRCVAEEVGRAFIHRKLGVEALAIRRPRSQAIGTPDTVPRNAADKLSRGRSLLVSVANKPWLALPNLSIIHAVWIKIARGRIRHTLDRRVFVCLGFFLNIRLHIMRKKKRE